MCDIIGKYVKEKTFTGYKIVVEDKYGHYYSPYSGIRYKKGKITVPGKLYKNSTNSAICGNKYVALHLKYNGIKWNDGMIGMTGVIIDKLSALIFYNRWKSGNTAIKYSVLEMTISGNLQYAQFSGFSTIIGNEIVSFKKIK